MKKLLIVMFFALQVYAQNNTVMIVIEPYNYLEPTNYSKMIVTKERNKYIVRGVEVVIRSNTSNLMRLYAKTLELFDSTFISMQIEEEAINAVIHGKQWIDINRSVLASSIKGTNRFRLLTEIYTPKEFLLEKISRSIVFELEVTQ